MLLCLLLTFGPAVLTWWRNRALVRLLDDPALPERLLTNARTTGLVMSVASVLLVLNWPDRAIWAIPTALLARMAAGFPLRRRVYDETWGLGRYLWFFVRLSFAWAGFWLLLAFAPTLTNKDGAAGWVLAGMVSVVLLIWSARYGDFFRLILRARPIDDPRLIARTTALVATCGLKPPLFERVDLHGGVLANAVALPSLRQSAIVMTDTMLTRFDADEVMAIVAHELAHLEHYHARRLRLMRLGNYVFIAAVTFIPPSLRFVHHPVSTAWMSVWAAALFSALVLSARRRQKHETASDLRAVALTGDPDALIRALIKLHEIARVPRRRDASSERRATHPSLARRLQAIRNAAGHVPASLETAAVFEAADGTSSVTVHDDRLLWTQRDQTTSTLDYSALSELRVHTPTAGAARLVATDRTGTRWEMPLSPADVSRAQAVLDIVDWRLAAPGTAPVRMFALARLLTTVCALLGLAVGQVSLAVIAALAAIVPAASLSTAAGVCAVVGAGLLWRMHDVWPGYETDPALTASLLICGAGTLVLAWKHRHSKFRPAETYVTGAFAIAGLLMWIVVLADGLDVVAVHQALRAWSGATLLPLAFAGATIWWRRSLALRAAGAALGLVGLFGLAAGSQTFLDWFGRDAFLKPTTPFAVKSLTGSPFARFEVPFETTDVLSSPHGRTIAVVTTDDEDRSTFHIGHPAGALVPIEGDDLLFADDEHALLLNGGPDSTSVTELDLVDGAIRRWKHDVPDLWGAQLTIDATGTAWAMIGQTSAGEFLRVHGTLREGAHGETQRWTAPTGPKAWRRILATHSERAVLMTTTRDAGLLGDSRLRWNLWLQMPAALRSRLDVAGPAGVVELARSRLDVQCHSSSIDNELPVCTAFDGARTRVFTVDADGGLVPMGSLDGRLTVFRHMGGGLLSGFWRSAPIAVRLGTREAFVSDAIEGQLTVSPHVLAAVTPESSRSTVRLYAIR